MTASSTTGQFLLHQSLQLPLVAAAWLLLRGLAVLQCSRPFYWWGCSPLAHEEVEGAIHGFEAICSNRFPKA